MRINQKTEQLIKNIRNYNILQLFVISEMSKEYIGYMYNISISRVNQIIQKFMGDFGYTVNEIQSNFDLRMKFHRWKAKQCAKLILKARNLK